MHETLFGKSRVSLISCGDLSFAPETRLAKLDGLCLTIVTTIHPSERSIGEEFHRYKPRQAESWDDE